VLQGLLELLELIDRDRASPLVHAGADREAVSQGRLLRDVRAFASGLGGLDGEAEGGAWLAVHDPYLLLVGLLGTLGSTSCALMDSASAAADCDQVAAAGLPGAVICDDPRSPVCAWARARSVPVRGMDVGAGDGTARPRDGGPERRIRFLTSGSTGAPRCVALGLSQLTAAVRGVARTIRLGPGDVSLSVAPLSHTLGLVTTVLAAWASGGSVVFADLSRPGRLDAAISTARPTWCAASPALLRLLLRPGPGPDRDWASLRLLRSSAAPLPPELAERLEARFQVPVVNAYAMTEAPGEIASQGLDRDRAARTVGRPTVCQVEVRGAGGVGGPGGSGEVWIRGPNVAAAAPPAWWRTGDLGVLDGSGLLTITGRRDDVINQGGLKIWPSDLEAVVLEHPGVRAAVAFPIPHEGLGEVVGLAVEPRSGEAVDRAAIRRLLMDRLTRQKWPSTIVVCERIPLNRRGKVSRRHLWQLLGDRL
jgi:acyl-CoA synthetase (AMP-forming)/AMP-acid ligase II